ncbi:hypothetical protein [Actinoplanes sp. NPDC048796]|uniref:ROK family transcriptional regulator n=1 Tax=Actinoplanes sp. NPDC048796 TaxID=3155640 RepID=UPI0033D5A101
MSSAPQAPHQRWSSIVTRLRQLNVEAFISTLLDDGPSTAAELARAANVSVVTANRILQQLTADEVIVEVEARIGGPGPRARVFALRREALAVAAVVHQPGTLTVVRAGAHANEAPVTLAQDGPPTPEHLAEALSEVGARPGELAYLVAGTVRDGDRTPAARASCLQTELSSRLGCPVAVRSSVDLAAVAEARLGLARGVEDFLLVADDGMALVVGGEPRPGAHGAAGSLLTHGERVLDGTHARDAVSAIVATCLVTDPELVVLSARRPPAGKLRAALAHAVPTPPKVVKSRWGRVAAALGAVEVARELALTALLESASRARD